MKVKLSWLSSAGLAFVVAAVMSGCASYRPDPANIEALSLPQARRLVKDMLLRDPVTGKAQVEFCREDHDEHTVTRIRFVQDRVILQPDSCSGREYSLRDIDPRLEYFSYGDDTQAGLGTFKGQRGQDPALRRYVDALARLKQEALNPTWPAQEEARFEEGLASYRAASPKPELPEEARRYKVQAETSVRDKAFDDAADRYAQALELAPWWPEGRFNRALVLSEAADYPEAIAEMKRYLVLVPEAPNARAAQDKIYEWEGKVH